MFYTQKHPNSVMIGSWTELMLYSNRVSKLPLANIYSINVWELLNNDATFLHPLSNRQNFYYILKLITITEAVG